MFSHLPEHLGVLSKVLSLRGERCREGVHKMLMALRKGEMLVADDYLIEAIFVHAFPGQVHKPKIIE